MPKEQFLDPLSKHTYADIQQMAAKLRAMGIDPQQLDALNDDQLARYGFDPRVMHVVRGNYAGRGGYVRDNVDPGAMDQVLGKSSLREAARNLPEGERLLPGDIMITPGAGDNINDYVGTMMHESRHKGANNRGIFQEPGNPNNEALIRYMDQQYGGPATRARAADHLRRGFVQPYNPDSPPEAIANELARYQAESARRKANDPFSGQLDTPHLIQTAMRTPMADPRTLSQVTPQGSRYQMRPLDSRQQGAVDNDNPTDYSGWPVAPPFPMKIPQGSMYKPPIPGLPNADSVMQFTKERELSPYQRPLPESAMFKPGATFPQFSFNEYPRSNTTGLVDHTAWPIEQGWTQLPRPGDNPNLWIGPRPGTQVPGQLGAPPGSTKAPGVLSRQPQGIPEQVAMQQARSTYEPVGPLRDNFGMGAAAGMKAAVPTNEDAAAWRDKLVAQGKMRTWTDDQNVQHWGTAKQPVVQTEAGPEYKPVTQKFDKYGKSVV